MKKRLDILMVERGLADSREQAKACIMAGDVYVDGQKEDKPGTGVSETSEIEFRGKKLKYVSRGGLKLEKALQVFPISLEGKICMDIGASTGGFTDCMLQNGAVRVYSIDVGRGQLSWQLRNDSRVVCMEKTNFRYMAEGDLPEKPDFAAADVSFISLSRIFPPAFALLKDGAEMVCLIKPQFEAGRELVGKKGVVRDPSVHRDVIRKVLAYALEAGFAVAGLDYSPIRGPEGNIEYLLYLKRAGGAFPAESDPDTEAEEGDKSRADAGIPETVIVDTVRGAQEAFAP